MQRPHINNIYKSRGATKTGHPNGTTVYDLIALFWFSLIIIPFIYLSVAIQKLNDVLGIKCQLRGAVFLLIIFSLATVINVLVSPLSEKRILISFGLVTIGASLTSAKIVYIRDLQKKNIKRSRSDSNVEDTVNFRDVWSNSQLFELFANHCVREYSRYTLYYILSIFEHGK